MNNNHHLSKFVRIGEIADSGLFTITKSTTSAVEPIPWNQYVAETKGFACDWADQSKGGRFKKA
jgi:urea transport system substrate-binding protein